MPKLVFISATGGTTEVDALPGTSVMEAAQANAIAGILGECGGSLSCGTCHCYVADAWMNRLPSPGPEEEAMLEAVLDRRPNSRLSCRIAVGVETDGLELHLPERQF